MVEELSKEKPDFMDCFKQSIGWFSVGVVVFTLIYLFKFFTEPLNIFDIEMIKISLDVFFETPMKYVSEILIRNCENTLIILLLSLTGYSIFAKIYNLLCGIGIATILWLFNYQHIILSIVYVLPHCLIELPTFFACMALAMQLSADRSNWKYYFKWYAIAIIPLLIVAALVEVYITPNVILWYLNTGTLL